MCGYNAALSALRHVDPDSRTAISAAGSHPVGAR
jgi:hypothetical protein